MEDFSKRKYRPVGRCIYCGYCESQENLSREHIIPFGLSGTTYLPKASCQVCRDITQKFEEEVLRGPMWPVRAKLKLKSRRPEDAPTTLPLQIVRENGEETIFLPLEEHPLILFMPKFNPPACLTGQNNHKGVTVTGYYAISFGVKPETVATRLKIKEFRVNSKYEYVAFARMIAKIGFSFAVGELGIDSFKEVFVIPSILGKIDEIGRWVGIGDSEPSKYENLLHRVSIGIFPETKLLYATVQLFANSDTPSYLVVVGSVKDDTKISPA